MELAFFHTAGFGTVGGLLMGSRWTAERSLRLHIFAGIQIVESALLNQSTLWRKDRLTTTGLRYT
jgi:hypothetical protein